MKLRRRLRYNRKRTFTFIFLFLMVLGITLGYAFLTTSLNVNGALEVSSSSWDIHFANIIEDQNGVEATTAPTVSNNTTITFAVDLEKATDFYSFTADIINDGTYDAKIDSITITPTLTTEQQNYFKYEVTYSDGTQIQANDALDSGTSENIKVYLEYKENADTSLYPEEDEDFEFSVTITYVQGKGNEVEHPQIVYTVNKYDDSVTTPQYNAVWLNQAFPASITQYQTPSEALAAIATASSKDLPFYLKHKIENGIVTESYVEFVVTPEMASANTGMVAGTYTLRGGIDESSLTDKPVFIQNAKTIYDAFGTNCSTNPYTTTISSSDFSCSVSGLYAYAGAYGSVDADVSGGSNCSVNDDGGSDCYWW